ncbi:MAG: UbiA family prenyltransferase, partial [Bacteroidia bacterium]|nr:UbiA family prenyltransferase [Bacteroidia bacterium]
PLVPGLYELHLAANKFKVLTQAPFEVNFKAIFNFITGFSVLAFLINLTREIIKDIEDMDGDQPFGCRTLPIVLGIDTARNLSCFLSFVIMLVIGYVQLGQHRTGATLSFWYMTIFVQLPMAFIIYLLLRAKVPQDFKLPDTLSKLVMLTGILYTLLIYYSFMPS